MALPSHNTSLRGDRAGAQPGTEEEIIERSAYWLVPWLMLDWFSYTTKGNLPRDGAANSGRDSHPPNTNHDNLSQIASHANAIEASFQLTFLSDSGLYYVVSKTKQDNTIIQFVEMQPYGVLLLFCPCLSFPLPHHSLFSFLRYLKYLFFLSLKITKYKGFKAMMENLTWGAFCLTPSKTLFTSLC